MRRFIKSLGGNAHGATAVEYGLIVALIVIVLVSGVRVLGGSTGGIWGNMANKVSAVTPTA